MQLLCFLLQFAQFICFSINNEISLLDLFIQDGDFIVFLIQLIDGEILVSLKVAVDLMHVFILYDVLFQQ